MTPADYKAPIADYRGYVRRRLGTLGGQVAALRAAIARGDLGAARSAWTRADATYESIGAAYGAFGDLDAAVNGRPAGLPGGVRSADFTGLHRVELALWQRSSTRDAARPAAQLARAVARMCAQVARLEIDPLEYSLRAHEILEDGALDGLARGDGSLPRWDQLGQRDRERIDGLAAGAAEQLAYVPELIDPRPARPAQRPFGESG